MANWNLSFDFAAVMLIALMLVFFFDERMVPMRSHRVFLWILIISMLITTLEILATFMARHVDVVGYDKLYAVLSVYTMFLHLGPLTFSYYLLCLVHVDAFQHKVLGPLFSLCVAADVLFNLVNLKVHWVFTFDTAYHSSYGAAILYCLDTVVMGVAFLAIYRQHKGFAFLRLGPLLFTLFFVIVSAFAQAIAYVPMLNLMSAIVTLTLFHYQQNAGHVTDMLTGQFNRRFMGEFLNSKFAESAGFGVIMVAMDNFKYINKSCGVENGDELLRQVGFYLGGIRTPSLVFRFGLDQFCLVVDGRNMKRMSIIAEQIRERFRHSWAMLENARITMSASICVLECPRDARSYDELVDALDYCMGIAKKFKRGDITYAGELDFSRIRQEKAIEKSARIALDKRELLVYYQPIYSVLANGYNSAEALVRLHDDELGWISPEVFIPLAEKNGLIVEMGEIILEKVCAFIHDCDLANTAIEYIEVNVSPVQLMQANFARRVKDILEKYGVQPRQINIEITETATIGPSAVVYDNIRSLTEYGITLSLDDYGSGNANVEYLNHLPFTLVKLDKQIIWDSFKDQRAKISLEHTVAMLNALDLHIVAEGVEDEQTKQLLSEIGCHFLQGWYFSKAVPEDEFLRTITSAA